MVDIKPIYLNKGYLFQNKIYYLDKICLCFAKIRFFKHTLYKSSRLELFCKKSVLRNFAKFIGKNTCATVSFFNKVRALRPATLLKIRLSHRCFPVKRNTFFYKTPPVAASVCIYQTGYQINWLSDRLYPTKHKKAACSRLICWSVVPSWNM